MFDKSLRSGLTNYQYIDHFSYENFPDNTVDSKHYYFAYSVHSKTSELFVHSNDQNVHSN